jgi:protocatechuate 4,5-dioxygenase alpha subunit
MKQDIPGTIVFDGALAQKGLALNKMCFSFNDAENRAAFLRDEDGYCDKYGLTSEQRAAVKHRDTLPAAMSIIWRSSPASSASTFRIWGRSRPG